MNPVIPNNFSLAVHRFRFFDCTVTPEQTGDIESPDLWSNVAHNLQVGDEIRAVVDDYSAVYYLFVTFVSGTRVRVKTLEKYELDEVAPTDTDSDEKSRLSVKMRGPKKWSVVDNESGEVLVEGLATKSDAVKQLEEFRQILGIE